MSAGIMGRPACKLALCVALFMPIRLCDIVTADAPPTAGYSSDHRPGRTTWERERGGGRRHSVHNTQLCFVEKTFFFKVALGLESLQPVLNSRGLDPTLYFILKLSLFYGYNCLVTLFSLLKMELNCCTWIILLKHSILTHLDQ